MWLCVCVDICCVCNRKRNLCCVHRMDLLFDQRYIMQCSKIVASQLFLSQNGPCVYVARLAEVWKKKVSYVLRAEVKLRYHLCNN